jgi:hypothetical protein
MAAGFSKMGFRARIRQLRLKAFMRTNGQFQQRTSFDARIAVDAIKALVWPILLLSLVLVYREPISAVARLLPQKVRDSSRISVGSLSLEIAELAAKRGDNRAGVLLRDLSKESIEILLRSDRPTRIASTIANDPDYVGVWNLQAIWDLADAGLVQVYRARSETKNMNLSKATLAELLTIGAGDDDSAALDELQKRGQTAIAYELIREKSKELLNWLLAFRWEVETEVTTERRLLTRRASSDVRAKILELNYRLSPAGKIVYGAMVSVISERLSQTDSPPSKSSTAPLNSAQAVTGMSAGAEALKPSATATSTK